MFAPPRIRDCRDKRGNDQAKDAERSQSMANAADRAGKTSGGVAVGVPSVTALGRGRIVIARICTRCAAAGVARVPVALRERGSGHREAQKCTQRDHGCLLFHVISPSLIGELSICRCHSTSRNAYSTLRPLTHLCANRMIFGWSYFVRQASSSIRLSLSANLRGSVRLAGVRSPRADLERVAEERQNALDSIACEPYRSSRRSIA